MVLDIVSNKYGNYKKMSNPNLQNLPKAIRDDITKLQSLEERIRLLSQQKFAIDTSTQEKKKAIEELSEMEDDSVVYKQVGGILICSDKAKVLENLNDEISTLEMRKKTIERNESSVTQNYEELRKKVNQQLQS